MEQSEIKNTAKIGLVCVLEGNGTVDVVSDNVSDRQPSVNYSNTIWYRLLNVANRIITVTTLLLS